eukprot:CAMPEP_0206144266 /NCGR_PEP_ID=MMETSP1473-20131121/23556_1 /ASSEMBLY_ACC=CAM_ASM_001109 /TAXON_ID=1461547 /ORGANISM="Stichococcus sp, Strain RCC1054" /LENGTH=1146 /DNA_ID=CAMNT_0053540037 /DNA_START=541 /DNA_END=3978 /DNA_ORIENTATION=-
MASPEEQVAAMAWLTNSYPKTQQHDKHQMEQRYDQHFEHHQQHHQQPYVAHETQQRFSDSRDEFTEESYPPIHAWGDATFRSAVEAGSTVRSGVVGHAATVQTSIQASQLGIGTVSGTTDREGTLLPIGSGSQSRNNFQSLLSTMSSNSVQQGTLASDDIGYDASVRVQLTPAMPRHNAPTITSLESVLPVVSASKPAPRLAAKAAASKPSSRSSWSTGGGSDEPAFMRGVARLSQPRASMTSLIADSRERGEAHHAASAATSAVSRSLTHVSSSPALHTSTAVSAGGLQSSPNAAAAQGTGASRPPHIAVRVRSTSGHPLGYADRLGNHSGGGNSGSIGGGGGVGVGSGSGSSGVDRGGYFRSQSTGSLGGSCQVWAGHHDHCEAGLETVSETVKETPTSDEQLPLLGLEIESSSGGGVGGNGGTDGRVGDGGGRGNEVAASPAVHGIKSAVAAMAGTTATTSAELDDEAWLEEEEVAAKAPGWVARCRRHWRLALSAAAAAAALCCAITLRLLRPQMMWMYLPAWRWCVFAATLLPMVYITRIAMHAAVLLLESRSLANHAAVYYAVAIWEPVLNVLRALILVPMFVLVFDDEPRAAGATADAAWGWHISLKVLVCVVIFTSATVAKTLAAKLAASSFHRQAHFDKMQDALSKEYFLQALAQPREEAGSDSGGPIPGSLSSAALSESLRCRKGGRRVASALAAGGAARRSSAASEFADFLSDVRRGVALGVRVTTRLPESASRGFSRLMGPGRPIRTRRPPAAARIVAAQSDAAAATLAGLDRMKRAGAPPAARLARMEQHMRENKLRAATLTERLSRGAQIAAQGEAEEVTSAKEARRLAYFLFWNVLPTGVQRDHVTQEDLEAFLSPDKVRAALDSLDLDKDGHISLQDMRDAVLQIYKERKHLAFTLADAKSVVARLEAVLGVAAHTLAAFAYLVIFRVDVGRVWLMASSCLLAFVFVFGNNIRSVYESLVFLFGVHPFDVGDVLLLDNKDWAKVEEIGLLNTVVVRWDGVKCWVPNARLAAETVPNVSRSEPRWEGFKVAVDITTAPTVFESVKADLEEFFAGNLGEYSGKFLCVANFAGDPLKFTLCVWWEYSHCGEELGRLSLARHGLYMRVAAKLGSMGVRYTLPPYQGMENGMGLP